MATVPLPLVEKNCGLALEETLPDVVARRAGLRDVLAVCLDYRRMGIAKLFATGLPDAFFQALSRSARAFLYFLEGTSEGEKVTGRADPFYDAVACHDLDAAVRIARCSRATWRQGKEYEEDFLYARFWMEWFALRAPRAVLDPILGRWEQVLEGRRDPKHDLCRAVLEKDQHAFDAALEAVVTAKREEIARALEGERLVPEDVPTTAKLWVELLAILRFAAEAGLATERSYPLAPSVARRVERSLLPGPDDWRSIPSYRQMR